MCIHRLSSTEDNSFLGFDERDITTNENVHDLDKNLAYSTEHFVFNG